jgi:hypothetical protein
MGCEKIASSIIPNQAEKMNQTRKATQIPQEGYFSFLLKNITNQFNKDAYRTKVPEQIIGSLIF